MTIDLSDFNDEELRKLAVTLEALDKKDVKNTEKPRNDDELHAWILNNLGINVTRKATCPEHDAPFDVIADLFFGREDSALVIGSRGSGKTYIASLWIYLSCHFNPNIEAATVGAIEIQAKRAYSYLKDFINKKGDEKIADSLISETKWEHGAKAEILTGSKSSVNGPHPQRVHRDEIELMDIDVYEESLMMESSKKTPDGEFIKAQTLVTSTRKTSDGLMQKIIDECEEAKREGRKPPFRIYNICIKDVIEQVPNCREAYPDLPEEEKCQCHLVQNGEWDDGRPRLFSDVCGGILANAQGYKPIADAHTIFLKSSKHKWEAQQENKRPYVEDITFPEFSRERHGIREFELDPANGPIYCSIDFGGSNPHAVEWVQVLDYEIEVIGYNGQPKRLKEGTRVLFDELYIAEIGNKKLADLIVEKEMMYRRLKQGFKVAGRFADPQAKAARLDFRDHRPPLVCSWPAVTRDREEHVKRMRDILVDNLFVVDVERCEMFCEEIEVWHQKNKKFDHAVDSALYNVSNIYALEVSNDRKSFETPAHMGKNHIYGPTPFGDDSIPVARRSPLRSARSLNKWD